MIPVSSSNLLGIGPYTPYENSNPPMGDLAVWFRDGSAGFYQDVPPEIWQQFQDAPSKGKFLHDVISTQGYTYIKFQSKGGSPIAPSQSFF